MPNTPSTFLLPDALPVSAAAKGIDDLLPLIETSLEAACRFGQGCPERLGSAIRYAMLAPGKRLRPALVLMAAEACGGSFAQAMPAAVAVEMVHAYSLIHDDLPAMDDDDVRRGRPTVHVQFDEATAILAGDALLAEAFLHLAVNVPDPAKAREAVRVLAEAAGATRLVGGQADDLAAESRADRSRDGNQSRPASWPSPAHGPDDRRAQLEQLESIHRRKTGALFSAALDLGGILSGAENSQRQILSNYARDLGLAFQVVDDLLDMTADEAAMGKRTGKDASRGKLTYPGLLGVDQARAKAEQLVESALREVAVLGADACRLLWLARFVLERTH